MHLQNLQNLQDFVDEQERVVTQMRLWTVGGRMELKTRPDWMKVWGFEAVKKLYNVAWSKPNVPSTAWKLRHSLRWQRKYKLLQSFLQVFKDFLFFFQF